MSNSLPARSRARVKLSQSGLFSTDSALPWAGQHVHSRLTKLYDRRTDDISLDEVEKIAI
jgi:hypothetical protein